MTPSGADDPAPVVVINSGGRSPFLLTGDHAGIAIPERLGDLGIAPADMARHIACDIGVRGVGEALAARLDAVFIRQSYSRLVIDCNRDPASPDAMPILSDGTDVPGNRDMTAAARAWRVAAIHEPYQQAIAHEIERRTTAGIACIFIALHSFTPAMAGIARPWHVGVLHGGGDERYAEALVTAFTGFGDLVVGDNEPYRMDATDYSVPRHAFPAGVPYAEIEIRQDLIADAAGHQRWSAILAEALPAAARAIR